MKYLSAIILTLSLSSCGIAVYEDSSQSASQYKGELTVINEAYDDQIKVEVSLSDHDSGYIPNLYVSPRSSSVRRFRLDSYSCPLTSGYRLDCERSLKFYREGRLLTYCKGSSVLEVDYECDEIECKPIQDEWQNLSCYNID